MKHHDIVKPIGLTTLCAEVEATCKKAHVYKRCGLRPGHLIIPLDSGSGRTTFIEYMTDMYKESGVLDFASGLDDYIEITLNGSLKQLRQAFAEIDDAGVYNVYSEIIGIDITQLAPHRNEVQYTEFLTNMKQICRHACIIFFVHSVPSRNEEYLIDKLCENLDNIKRLDVEPYTNDDICDLVMKIIIKHGVSIKRNQAFRSVLLDMVTELNILNVKDAIFTADTLVYYADFSGFIPVVDEGSLKALIERWRNGTERSEVK